MAKSFQELVKEYGAPPLIPHAVLYAYIIQPEVRKPLIDSANLGLDRLLKAPLVSEVRRRSKTDLFWLAKYFLWGTNPEGAGKPIEMNKMTEATHKPLCDLFVQKDDAKNIEDQDKICKERIVLYPRGSFKSTIDVCDVVQWILNFPEIRILFLTAADDLAVGFVDETKGHFVIRVGDPSLMNLFFPEYCLQESMLGSQFEFTCPLWSAKQVKRKEPTVMASSIVSTLSGWHFDVIKGDDVVSNRNSENEEQCQKVIKNLFINVKMLMPYGYKDLLGTRYRDEDVYGHAIERNVGDLVVTTGLSNTDTRPWTLTVNRTTGTKILIGKGWLLKPEIETDLLAGKIKEEDVKKEHYFILFPENLPYEKLRRMQKEDEESFEGQINQNPRPKSAVVFDRPLMLRHTVPFTQLPVGGPVSITWDFAFSQKKGRDYSTAAVGIYNEKSQLFIIDLIRERFNHTSLAKAVVNLAQKWHPVVVGIEDIAGSRFLEPTIIAEAQKRGMPWLLDVCAKIDWFVPDTQKDAKKQRMAALYPWLTEDRLFFASHLPHLETLYSEFERCLTSHHHDDIPDVTSQQTRYAPRLQMMITKREIMTWTREDAAWNLVFEDNCDAFGQPGMGPPPMPLTPPPPDRGLEAEVPYSGMESILGSGLCG